MAADRKLSRDFWLHEFPGWGNATESDVAALQETVVRVLQPVRDAMGVPVRPSSWMWWSDGTGRTGSHSEPGTVDFVVDDGKTFEAFEWIDRHLVPMGYIGRNIYEPERSSDEGRPQGEHIHLAPRGAMVAVFDDPRIQSYVETSEGDYELFRAAAGLTAGGLALLAGWLFLAGRREPAHT